MTTSKYGDFAKRLKDLRDYRSDDSNLRWETAETFDALLSLIMGQRDPQQASELAALQAEVTDLRRQKADLVTSLDATMTAWHKDKAALESQLATLKQSSDRYHDEAYDLRTQLDAATKRAELAEATGYSGLMPWEDVRDLWVSEETSTEDFIERGRRYRRLTRPGPLSGPNPFYKFWALRRRIRPLFASTWGAA